jgi:hypothetical protein
VPTSSKQHVTTQPKCRTLPTSYSIPGSFCISTYVYDENIISPKLKTIIEAVVKASIEDVYEIKTDVKDIITNPIDFADKVPTTIRISSRVHNPRERRDSGGRHPAI